MTHVDFMHRCLLLAENARGSVAPNPMVGAVIVKDNTIIGEGFHTAFGKPHAEVEAVRSVIQKELIAGSTLYVSLEPCCHQGKTPPCTTMIIEKGISKVVVAMRDPNPLVSGKGIQILRDAGIEVIEHILCKEAENLNRRFVKFHTKKQPYIILKWAQTADKFIDIERENDTPQINWISNVHTKQLVHKWRSEEQAILVGSKTVLMDNPFLTNRLWSGKHPIRILIDPNLKVPLHYNIYNADALTICFYNNNLQIPKTFANTIQFIPLTNDQPVYLQVINYLYHYGIQSLIVEGGRYTLMEFIHSGLWDEARVIEGNVFFDKGLSAPILNMKPALTEQIESDSIKYYFNIKS